MAGSAKNPHMTSTQTRRYSDEFIPNGNSLAIRSISLSVANLVRAPGLRARVESVFAEACNLVTENGQRFSLVSDQIGNGPLNAVLSRGRAICILSPGDQVTGDGSWLFLPCGLRADLHQARRWDPYPDYPRLAFRPHCVAKHVASLRNTLPLEAPPASLAARPGLSTQGAFGSRPAMALIQSRARRLTNGLLAAYRHRNLAGIQAHARQLTGLGAGLTPAGDDWLGGWLIGLHVRAAMEPDGESRQPLPVATVGRTVVDAADGRTTGLSLAYLSAAACGAAPQIWHDFLYALVDADSDPVQRAAAGIMRHGATSGSDALAGFLAAFVQAP